MTIQHQHPTKDAPGQTYNNQNQQKTASTIHEYQIYFVPLQWLCAIADYIFGFGCRCSDYICTFFCLYMMTEKVMGVVVFGYPTATQKKKNALFMGISRVLFVAGGGPEPSTSGL